LAHRLLSKKLPNNWSISKKSIFCLHVLTHDFARYSRPQGQCPKTIMVQNMQGYSHIKKADLTSNIPAN